MATTVVQGVSVGNDKHWVAPVVYPPKVNFLKNFVYGGFAGFVGSLCTFPIDLCKTLVQMEKEPKRYKGIFHCMRVVASEGGARALYRGLPVQLIGIIPEKALKLSVNDMGRRYLRNPDGTISLANEAFAGGFAGFAQVLITSPMEMLKIRMQEQSKIIDPKLKKPFGQVLREVLRGGVRGVYQGAGATLLRDVPFSLLYFPMFSNMKKYFATFEQSSLFRRPDSDHIADVNQLLGTFVAGLVSGSVCAFVVTPADVIKTRLQGEKRLVYKNIRTCIRMTAQEGMGAFLQGAPARLLLIGPLFGIVLLTYEFMPKYFPL